MKTYARPSEIKVGVVGYGGAFNMGKKHLDEMQAQGMVPTAVAEMDPARLEVALSDFPGIGVFTSLEEMLAGSDVDLVTLITPHNTHAPLALEALRAGRHVVSEKPLALTTDECDAMIAAAEASGVMLSTYHNRHWDGLPRTALKLIREQGAIGEVYRIVCQMGRRANPGDWWRTSRAISGGVLYDWGVHLLEYCLQIIDADLVEVSGYATSGYWGSRTKWGEEANEDEATAIARFANGVRAEVTFTNLDSEPMDGILRVVGTEGSLTFTDPNGDYRLVKREGWDRVTTECAKPLLPTEHERYYENVAAFLTGQAELVITPAWSRRPIHILDLAAQSAREGRALPVRYV